MRLFILGLSAFLSSIGITVVIPLITGAVDVFGVSQADAMWVITAFMVTYASFMPLVGKLSDSLGRKRIFVLSSGVFALGLFLSSITKNFGLVVLGRVLQGLGSGGILPVINAMAAEGKKPERDLALINAMYGLGMIGGINLGGLIYDSLGWRYLFLIPLVLEVITVILSEIFIESVPGTGESVDWMGGVSFAVFLGAFTLSFKYAGDRIGYVFPVVSALSLLWFITVERKATHPIIDVSLFRNRDFTVYNVSALIFGFVMFTTVTMLAPYIQIALGLEIAESVYYIDPFALAMVSAIALSGLLMKKLGSRVVMALGFTSLALTLWLFQRYSVDLLGFLITSVLLGLSMGFPMAPMNHLVMDSVEEKRRGVAAGLVSVMRSVGGVIGPSVAGLVISKVDFSSIFAVDNLINAYLEIFSIAFYVSVVGMFLVWIFVKKPQEVIES